MPDISSLPILIISLIRSQFALHSPNIIFICQTAGDWQNADSVETLRSPSEHVQAQQSLVSVYLYKFNNTSYVATLVSLFLKGGKLCCSLPCSLTDLFA